MRHVLSTFLRSSLFNVNIQLSSVYGSMASYTRDYHSYVSLIELGHTFLEACFGDWILLPAFQLGHF